MIEMTQVTNLFAQARDLQSIVEVGRTCAAFSGGLLVFATFWPARLALPDLGALAAAAATAATPLVTVHARMKEDIFDRNRSRDHPILSRVEPFGAGLSVRAVNVRRNAFPVLINDQEGLVSCLGMHAVAHYKGMGFCQNRALSCSEGLCLQSMKLAPASSLYR
jgi:hypothetical protein